MTHHILILIISLLLSPSHYHYHNNHFNIFIDTTGVCIQQDQDDGTLFCADCQTACQWGYDDFHFGQCGPFCFQAVEKCPCPGGYR